MKRDLYPKLLAWRSSARRKPLVLRGARQVGKTFLLKAFGARGYKDCAYFNFEEDPSLDRFFQGKLDPKEILEKLSIYAEKKILPHKTLIFFDEIQESERALSSLKYFGETANEYHVASAGSLLGIKLSQSGSFPVGKVNFETLYPLSFFEFLNAVEKPSLRAYLEESRRVDPLPDPFHQELIDWLRKYYFIGGMPEAVKQYVEGQDFEKVREVHHEILTSYQLDFSKHVSPSDILKISALWESTPAQLAKENKKFVYSALQKSARAREYETALQWLQDAGLILKSHLITTPKFPLKGYRDPQSFKVYLLDVGLLGSMSQMPAKILLEGDRMFQEFHGSLVENYVAQELTASIATDLFYWASEGKAEVDFLISKDDEIFPLEVKAGLARGAKSLHVYDEKYHPKRLIRTSLRNLKRDGKLLNLPLYMVSTLK